jgi:translation initiation factor 2B subunit (eIF-2B alpha/beta/delta family)
LRDFTLRLVASQPSMAGFLMLANALWLGRTGRTGTGISWKDLAWEELEYALVQYARRVDPVLQQTVRRAASLIRSGSLVLTYSHSSAVRLTLSRAKAMGRRFEVICSESRPMREGVDLASRLGAEGIWVHLVVDAALVEWVGRADLVLLGADAVTREHVFNKVGTEALLLAARRHGIPSLILADSSKWLPNPLAVFWRVRDEAPDEVARLRDPNVTVHNRYFGAAPLSLITGLVWEDGLASPGEVRKRIARIPVSEALVRLLGGSRHRGR